MHKLRYLLNIGIRRISSFLGITLLLPHKFGYKVINPQLGILDTKMDPSKLVSIPITALRFCTDNLIDEYSLLNLEVHQTPHYDLMKRMVLNEDINDSLYINRVKKGNLDGRLAVDYGENHYSEKFLQRKNEILNSKSPPIFIFKKNNFNYIIDGKHRVSLALVLGKENVMAQIIERNFEHSLYKRILRKMVKKNDTSFRKHIEFYRRKSNYED